eukprot:TRINITY_DN11945_c0_g1_i1.p1 TRINITY_DN11945_c0_g1~~TRINITY_DN11945_c0_g1_i1.p1  ORF type:complete len:427 (+),score=77.76 TRINITY_DN11945_c0_g1_i1:122-1282(+)
MESLRQATPQTPPTGTPPRTAASVQRQAYPQLPPIPRPELRPLPVQPAPPPPADSPQRPTVAAAPTPGHPGAAADFTFSPQQWWSEQCPRRLSGDAGPEGPAQRLPGLWCLYTPVELGAHPSPPPRVPEAPAPRRHHCGHGHAQAARRHPRLPALFAEPQPLVVVKGAAPGSCKGLLVCQADILPRSEINASPLRRRPQPAAEATPAAPQPEHRAAERQQRRDQPAAQRQPSHLQLTPDVLPEPEPPLRLQFGAALQAHHFPEHQRHLYRDVRLRRMMYGEESSLVAAPQPLLQRPPPGQKPAPRPRLLPVQYEPPHPPPPAAMLPRMLPARAAPRPAPQPPAPPQQQKVSRAKRPPDPSVCAADRTCSRLTPWQSQTPTMPRFGS